MVPCLGTVGWSAPAVALQLVLLLASAVHVETTVTQLPDAPVWYTACPTSSYQIRYSPPTAELLPQLELVFNNAVAKGFDEVPADPTFFALMITGKDEAHEYFARKSMESFVHQAATRKVLVIINDSPKYTLTGPVSEWLADMQTSVMASPPPCVVEIRVEPKRYVLGDLRNIGINAVPLGGVWVQWDDDDWHDRQYMTLNGKEMVTSNTHALTIKSQYRYFFTKNSSYIHQPAIAFGIEGTVMVFKTPTVAPIQYRAKGRAEDTIYLRMLRQAEVPAAAWDNPTWLYFRFYHGINTWDANHYRINKLPDENAWCCHLPTHACGCADEMANELHAFVIEVYQDVAAALAAAPS
ncbi:uncharacterized protein MONBRDRAFT_12882 [Monosiga brevicollis MX1]|uniref:Uncharacterized protein n=1 Tax=Monosiga brevicollis TaxID=81824 RepID=A9VDM1_MONBE|nr:uncharacterized protein MONBRDRAFT_12882 [Monosiga brevicollis MX1]EDQ84387.1 predicted protein [Monosiga brevicollis MX1]|eukprot:XP_001750788.1 hypothetical protein [Monosiga brevicollis MX1]